ncbi:DUF4833 domain-containing protein [Flavobacterium psychrophilum]|uniref:DUF4833 domain-containing protein n=7 Tax=Flavobacterium psychrophilum TaxID=96345 RepID=A6GYC0_FLAPJ|nr:DUF4833 domain-containing protein [Flavobacterium psychrophilum]AIG29809.1 hypothetical protein IA03_04695 [Flavobacterium psychrophilum]AIG32086.1 hypothetical protein IA01_04710 [Flavobacterium psychrophilum]AIG34241.1 hypothetical protein IA02_04115 [Flavobacterium psychrophilum]AIG36604.1 hypothetical protein IA04_04610 [Flavobacterium psychrophilum]AIG38869.1 hypothetical protein IA05_04695 [Flavobacterium psychrophilum]
MKFVCPIFLFFFNIGLVTAQENYPKPIKTKTLLFYIQHSNNYNTYLYDINMNGQTINSIDPIKEYRILYATDSSKRPLTKMQKKLAYGIVLKSSRDNLYKFNLAATDELLFYLNFDKKQPSKIYVTVNNQKMYLNKMFIQLEKAVLLENINIAYILFYGNDYNSNKAVVEKFILK